MARLGLAALFLLSPVWAGEQRGKTPVKPVPSVATPLAPAQLKLPDTGLKAPPALPPAAAAAPPAIEIPKATSRAPLDPETAPTAVLPAAARAAENRAASATLPPSLASAWAKAGASPEALRRLGALAQAAYPQDAPLYHSLETAHDALGLAAAMLAAVPVSELDMKERRNLLLAAFLHAAAPARPAGTLPRPEQTRAYLESDPDVRALMMELDVDPTRVRAYAAVMAYAPSPDVRRRLEESFFEEALAVFPVSQQARAGLWAQRLALLKAILPLVGTPRAVDRRVKLLAAEARATAAAALGRETKVPTDEAVFAAVKRQAEALKDSPDLALLPQDARLLLSQNLELMRPRAPEHSSAARRTGPAGAGAIVRVEREAAAGLSPLIDIRYEDGRQIQAVQTNRGLRELGGWSRHGHSEVSAAYPAELLDADALKGKSVLDVGTGGGAFVLDLRRHGVNAFGVDARLPEELKRMPSVFYEADGQWLPFPDASLDVLYSNWSIPVYVHEEQGFLPFLKEWARVLKKGGRLRVSPLHPDNYPLVLAAMKEFGLALSPDLKLVRVPEHNRGAFIGMRYELRWKGREWPGDPFLELAKTR